MKIKDMTKEDILSALGISTQSTATTVWTAVGALGAGILIGAGIGLLFAPKPGRDLRGDISRRINFRKNNEMETDEYGSIVTDTMTP